MTTLSYSDMSKLYANKAKHYNVEQCRAAIADIDSTLQLQAALPLQADSTTMVPMVPMTPYVVKLWCERDAMLDRLLALR